MSGNTRAEETRRGRSSVLAMLALLSLLSAAKCPPSVEVLRVLSPTQAIGATFEPLSLELDFSAWENPASFLVLLNGTDITSDFEISPTAYGRHLATAVDVWGAGLVLPGANELVARIGTFEVVHPFVVAGDPYADAVASFLPGAGAGYGQSMPGVVGPGVITGGPEGLGLFLGGLEVLSLGAGGLVVLEFVDNVIIDEPGLDFTVFENAFMTVVLGAVADPFAEPGRVSVSQDGVLWHVFDACETTPLEPPLFPGCAGVFPTLSNVLDPLTSHASIPTLSPISDLIGVPAGSVVLPEGSGGDSFDLADVGLDWARYVRIEDVGPAAGQAGTVGFDLDAVAAISSAPSTDANGNGIPDAVE